MGLDIHIGVNNADAIFTPDYYSKRKAEPNKYNLSRTFCNFMSRRNVVSHEPELDQIGKITGVDISPGYEMEEYPDEVWLEEELHDAKSVEERAAIRHKAEEAKNRLAGNIDKVLETVWFHYG